MAFTVSGTSTSHASPIADLARILEVLTRILHRGLDRPIALGGQVCNSRPRQGGVVQGERGKVKATHPIQHYHVERCRCRALLAEPTHMKASWLWPTSGGGGLPGYWPFGPMLARSALRITVTSMASWSTAPIAGGM